MATTTASRIHELSAKDVQAGLESGTMALVDVREPDEHAAERIAGARLAPLSGFEPTKVGADAATKIVLHCRSGGRSMKAARMLLNAGHDQAYSLRGGIDAWKGAGLPTERDASAPINVMRQVQITAGSLVLLGTILGFLVSPWFLALSGFVGAGLLFAGLTDTCGMAMMLAKMPWNRRWAS
jgi:rhodanese-related sulfurtransferase